ncbi:hypothetical protein [Luteolibacter marinus]|uniref:hypothetical protein n=1 Tax=Luteolibacter marinus TaxID=2776705 RepID=UPI001865AF50|nr:hypothetical protein [Luteolibacter marinus]
MPDPSEPQKLTRSQERFLEAPQLVQEIVRDCIKEERPLMHMKHRPEIHQKLTAIVKRHIS